MDIKAVLLCIFALLSTETSVAWGAAILSTSSITPSDLNTPTSTPGKNYMYSRVGCVDAYNGTFLNCGYDFTITGLATPNSDPANNGGHTHSYSAHPLGKLNVTFPFTGVPSSSLAGCS